MESAKALSSAPPRTANPRAKTSATKKNSNAMRGVSNRKPKMPTLRKLDNAAMATAASQYPRATCTPSRAKMQPRKITNDATPNQPCSKNKCTT